MKAKPVYALLLAVVVVVCYRLLGYTGHFGYDDMQYAEIAAGMLRGDVDYDDHFSFRTTVTGATTLSYKLFGINDIASSLPAMAMTMLALFAVYWVLRKRGFWPTAIGLALVVTSHWFLFYSNKLMPDVYVAAFSMMAACIYYHYRYRSERHAGWQAAAFAMALLLGFASKGTVVLLLPWLLYLFLTDCLRRKQPKFWLYAIGFGAVFLAVYFACTKALTGDFLYRFKSIAQNSYLNRCSYDEQPLGVLMKRLFFDFFDMTINSGMAVPLAFVATSFVSRRWRRMFALPDAESYFAVSALVLLLSGNFMTISATSYVPMCIDPRHYLFLIPIAATAAALFLAAGKPTRRQAGMVALLFVFFTVYSFFGNREFSLSVYLPITVASIASAALWNTRIPRWCMACALLAAMLICPIRQMADRSYEYNERRDALIDNVVNNRNLRLVVSDPVCTRLMRYYNGFDANGRYADFDKVDEKAAVGGEGSIGLVINHHTMVLSGLSVDALPDYAKDAAKRQTPVFDGYGTRVYAVDSLGLTVPDYDTLYSTVNTFDGDIPPFWHGDNNATGETSHSGSRSHKVDRYSATFTYPMDSLRGRGYDTVFVMVAAKCNCFGQTDCQLVVSVEDAGNNYSWNSSEIDGAVRAYSHWFPFGFKQELHLGELPSGTVMSVYFYKKGHAKVFIDDFGVAICAKTPITAFPCVSAKPSD